MRLRWTALVLMLALGASFSLPQTSARADTSVPPLVIVFDTSGSMASPDSSGTVKLSTAKAAMTELVRAQTPQVPLGLWTYPGGSTVDSCEVGRWIPGLSPDQRPDATEVDAQVRSLAADGGTPTGPALRAVADSLERHGFEAATIVLVSDGESNCGTPPCEVAQDIVDSGFNLTVAAVAFDIDSGRSGELECIANVTGGTFTQADDATDLINALEEYQTKDLELTVRAPETVRSGAVMTIEVTVTNPTHVAVPATSLLLSFDDKNLVPFVPAPQQRLPSIPANESITHTWTVATSSQLEGESGWRVLAGAPGMGSVSEAGVVRVITAGLKRDEGGDVLRSRGGTVVVLGDSYSSGEGAGDYLPDDGDLVCHRSPHAYGVVIAQDDDVELIACSGATVHTMMRGNSRVGQPNQFNALAAIDVPDMVLMTAGGNDVGFARIVEACFLGDCSVDRAFYVKDIASRGTHWRTYEAISEAINTPAMIDARGGALAPVIVSPYPDPFWDPSRGHCNGISATTWASSGLIKLLKWEEATDIGFSPAEIVAARQILTTLNGRVEEGVRIASDHGHPVFFADSVVNFATAHSICESDSYFKRLTPSTAVDAEILDSFGNEFKQELFHPNAAGHAAWADAVITWSQRTTIDDSQVAPRTPPPPVWSRLLDWLQRPVTSEPTSINESPGRPDEQGELPTSATTHTVSAEGTVIIQLNDLQPGSTVSITVRSEPITLAEARVDETGTVEVVVDLPRLSAGPHTLTAVGYDTRFQVAGVEVQLDVRSGFSRLALISLCVAGSSALGCLLALFIWKRFRRRSQAQ